MAIDMSILKSSDIKLRYKSNLVTDVYNVMVLNSNEFIFTTAFGIYKYVDNEKCFYKYYPEYAKPLMDAKGGFEVDNSECWLVAKTVDKVIFQKEIK